MTKQNEIQRLALNVNINISQRIRGKVVGARAHLAAGSNEPDLLCYLCIGVRSWQVIDQTQKHTKKTALSGSCTTDNADTNTRFDGQADVFQCLNFGFNC